MKHEKHITHYIILIMGLFLFVMMFILFRHNKPLQLAMGTASSMFYMSWGIIHHALEDRLTKFVVMEYGLFALLIFLLLLTGLSF